MQVFLSDFPERIACPSDLHMQCPYCGSSALLSGQFTPMWLLLGVSCVSFLGVPLHDSPFCSFFCGMTSRCSFAISLSGFPSGSSFVGPLRGFPFEFPVVVSLVWFS